MHKIFPLQAPSHSNYNPLDKDTEREVLSVGVALFPILSGHQAGEERTQITGSNTKGVTMEGVFGRPCRSSALDSGSGVAVTATPRV